MLDFQRKKKIRRTLYSPFVLIALAIVMVILSSGVFGVYKKAKLSKQNLEREKKELEKLAIREKTLASSIDYLKTDQGVEDEIRTKFRAVKDGEKVVVIIDNQSTTTLPENKQASSTSFWYNLFHW